MAGAAGVANVYETIDSLTGFLFIVPYIFYRGLAAHSNVAAETDLKTVQEKPLPQQKLSSEQPGWFSRLLDRDQAIDTGHEQHSSRLSDKDTVYELQCKCQTYR